MEVSQARSSTRNYFLIKPNPTSIGWKFNDMRTSEFQNEKNLISRKMFLKLENG